MDSRQRLLALAVGALAVVVIAIAAVLVLPSEKKQAATPAEAEGPAPRAASFVEGEPPNRLVVPVIGLDAPLTSIEVDTKGVLTPPDDASVVGWWQRSAHPGAKVGQTVLTGHTVHTGGGVMNKLGTVAKGELVQVHDDGRVVDYRVTKVFEYSKAELAENAYDLFGQDRLGGRLVLVTCTDWVDGDYLSNIIVFADPVRDEADAA